MKENIQSDKHSPNNVTRNRDSPFGFDVEERRRCLVAVAQVLQELDAGRVTAVGVLTALAHVLLVCLSRDSRLELLTAVLTTELLGRG